MNAGRTILMAAMISIAPLPATAEDAAPLLDRWYTALFDIDRDAFQALLADEAVIRLEDLAIDQTKDEFIAALDDWEDASKDADFAWQSDPEAPASETEATALVCYRFPANTIMTRETFRFESGRVIESVQKGIGDSCDDF